MTRCALFSLFTLVLSAQSVPAPAPAPAPAQAQAPAQKLTLPSPASIPTPKVSPATPEAQPIPEDQVLARIGRTILREKDFRDWLKIAAGRQAEEMLKTPAKLTRPRQQFLDLHVLAAKARALRVRELPEFTQALKIHEDQILVQLMMAEDRAGSEGRRLKEKVENPTDEEIQAYFEKNAQRYEVPEKFTARHLLVSLKGAPRGGDKGLTDEEAKARIALIQGELKAGKSLEALVPEYSDDPGSKGKGGLYKDVTFGSFAKEFEAAVRTQELGKVGEPVKTPFGYHLIQVEGRTPKQPAILDQVRDRVKKDMVPERREAMMKTFLEETRKEIGFVAGADAAASLPKTTGKKTDKH